ncbi:MAG TPA: hypothetical protein VJS90_14930 [Pseudomonas sp.]|uniref:hypothetical protein n=1 Tax=Pseudomonas sp. TaxID=306 RepID=UPI002B47BDCD|nr:hypothetical protein [Pseudomonas sp.]HKS14321.1 hypothetical protein [Pseudomonas sp.]
MNIPETIELNIVHPVAPADGSGYEVRLVDISEASRPELVFSQGANTVPASPFTYDFTLQAHHLKFGNQYRVTVHVTGLNGDVHSDEREFSVAQDEATKVIGLKLSRR